eukprot:7363700-Prymnesium_polylepis.1
MAERGAGGAPARPNLVEGQQALHARTGDKGWSPRCAHAAASPSRPHPPLSQCVHHMACLQGEWQIRTRGRNSYERPAGAVRTSPTMILMWCPA